MNGFYDIIANHIFERVINRQVLETEEFKTWLAKAKKWGFERRLVARLSAGLPAECSRGGLPWEKLL